MNNFNFYILILEIVLSCLVIGLFLLYLIFIFGKKYWKKEKEKSVIEVFQISPNKHSEQNLATAEHLFASLHGIFNARNWKQVLTGMPQENIAFEIVKQKGKIYFYARVPAYLSDFLIGQLYANYPNLEIVKTNDYVSDLLKNREIAFANISTVNSSLWPIKRFSQFADKTTLSFHDPLSGLLSPLDQGLDIDDLAGIQISYAPFDESLYREKAQNSLKKLSTLDFKYDFSEDLFDEKALLFGFWEHIHAIPSKIIIWIFSKKKKNDDGSIQEGESVTASVTSTHDKEDKLQAATDKLSRLMYSVNIKVFYAKKRENISLKTQMVRKIKEIYSPFKQFNLPYSNSFSLKNISFNAKHFAEKYAYGSVEENAMLLSSEELATVFHFPNETVMTPTLNWVQSRRMSPPENLPLESEADISVIGKTNYRSHSQVYGLRPNDKRRHVYIIGKTGMGKSTLLENMIHSDIHRGKGVAVIDPHGDLADAVLGFIPKRRINDVIIFEPADINFPISFNMLECRNPDQQSLVASGVLGVFKKMFADSWGPRLEHILRNTLLALIEAKGESIMGILRMLSDKKYRENILKKVHDPIVSSFWRDEFGKWNDKQITEAVAPIQNKVGQFLSVPIVRNILGQTKSSFDIRFAMDKNKIVVINLSKGKIGEDISALLGSMMITKFQLDVMSRADIAEAEREDFYLYVDEFQNFATDSFATILSEARKYKLNLIVANQYLAQMEDTVRDAIFGNVGSLISFQIGFDDAEKFSDQYGGDTVITPADIASLPKYQVYNRIMIDGMPSPVFSANTMPPPKSMRNEKLLEKIRSSSRMRYAKPRKVVEDQIKKWSS